MRPMSILRPELWWLLPGPESVSTQHFVPVGSTILTHNSLLPTHGEQSLATHQQQTQLISQFLDDYLPPRATPGSVSHQSPVYWAETFHSLLDSQSAIVKASLSALTLIHLANSQCDDALAHRARHYYSQTTQHIHALRRVEHPNDLIHTGMILALYEVYSHSPSHENAWQVHVQAAYNFMRESGFQTQALSKYDLRRLCTIEVRL
jgi:Fungal specific transcription factor domain